MIRHPQDEHNPMAMRLLLEAATTAGQDIYLAIGFCPALPRLVDVNCLPLGVAPTCRAGAEARVTFPNQIAVFSDMHIRRWILRVLEALETEKDSTVVVGLLVAARSMARRIGLRIDEGEEPQVERVLRIRERVQTALGVVEIGTGRRLAGEIFDFAVSVNRAAAREVARG